MLGPSQAFCASSMTRPWSGPELKHQGPRQSGLVCRTGGGAGERAEGVSMAAINEQSNVSSINVSYTASQC